MSRGGFQILGVGQHTRRSARGRGMYEIDEAPKFRPQAKRKLPPWSKIHTKAGRRA